jgi:opacity protein-like surface antigen
MRSKPYVGLALALLVLGAASCVHAQTVPTAEGKGIPFAVGLGLSVYNADVGHGQLLGGTLWVDYIPNRVPKFLEGFRLEAEARDLNYGRSGTQPANLREDVVEGGLVYSWPHFRNIRPYAKFSEGYGNTDSTSSITGVRYHDSRTIISGGGGVEYRAYRRLWVRADYEYQSWPNFFKHPATPTTPARPSQRLNPQGITVGVLYHLTRPHFH